MRTLDLARTATAYAHALLARLYFRDTCECLWCGARLGRFVPFRMGRTSLPPFLAAVDIIGSDVDNYKCPYCASNDRERHLLLFLRTTGDLERMRGAHILHFAPEKHLTKAIASVPPARYVKADLFPHSDDVSKVDILRMQFESDTFDWVIANHVLEHVEDDRKALAEICRVLRPGGRAILQTPYSAMLRSTFEDPGIGTANARLQAYGQEDHVRLYGRDIFERFASSGLVPHVRTHAELLSHIDARRYGVNPSEPFFLFERPHSSASRTS